MTDPADYTMRTPPTWARDLGALRAIADWEAQRQPFTFGDAHSVAEATGVDPVLLQQSLDRWETVQPPVLDGAQPDMDVLMFLGLSERGRRIVGLWPSADQVVDQLVAALNDAADDEPDEGQKSKLRAAGAVIASMGRQIAVSVIAKQLGDVV